MIIWHLKKAKIRFKLAGLFLLFLIFLQGCFSSPVSKLCLNKKICMKVEIARTKDARVRGLMFRRSLAAKGGMLFIFEQEGIHGIWMKNMRFPLDLIWIGSDKKIADISRNVLPCKDVCKTYFPKHFVAYVLEVNAGFADRFGLQVSDQLDF